MNAQLYILDSLYNICRDRQFFDERLFPSHPILWDEREMLRRCALRAQRGDPGGWKEFVAYLRSNKQAANGFGRLFLEAGLAAREDEEPQRSSEYWDSPNEMLQIQQSLRFLLTSISKAFIKLRPDLPADAPLLDAQTQRELEEIFNPDDEIRDERPKKSAHLGQIMYIEEKPGLAGHARIGRVTFSASRKTIYYRGRSLLAIKGYKTNHVNVDSGLYYWISNCKKAGNDTLYPGIVEIDEDARVEYWTEIRRQPQNVHLTKFRSEGKYSKRRPA